jgi:hypothetical protein
MVIAVYGHEAVELLGEHLIVRTIEHRRAQRTYVDAPGCELRDERRVAQVDLLQRFGECLAILLSYRAAHGVNYLLDWGHRLQTSQPARSTPAGS